MCASAFVWHGSMRATDCSGTLQALDFAMNRVLLKLFKTSNIEIIEGCRRFLHVELPSVQRGKRFQKFLSQL